jgi:hypothetical protein
MSEVKKWESLRKVDRWVKREEKKVGLQRRYISFLSLHETINTSKKPISLKRGFRANPPTACPLCPPPSHFAIPRRSIYGAGSISARCAHMPVRMRAGTRAASPGRHRRACGQALSILPRPNCSDGGSRYIQYGTYNTGKLSNVMASGPTEMRSCWKGPTRQICLDD